MSNTVEDIWEAGGVLALALFGLVGYLMIVSADSIEESTNLFARFVTVLVFAAFPTSEVGVFLAVVMAVIGASISISTLGSKVKSMLFAAGFFWCGTNIVMAWFFSPV